jgi:proteasome accessory factor B
MPDLTQLERALRILQRLITHDGVTVQELYDLFDRREPIRTIQRTLDSIQSSHIPLDYSTGAHGIRYYRIRRAFDYIPLTLSPDEILAALLLAQFGDLFQNTRIGDDIAGVFEKLDQLVPPGSVAITTALHGATDVVSFKQPGMVDMQARENTLRDLFLSIIERGECWIEYSKPSEEKISRFNFYPYSLLFHSGAIYAIGYQPYYKNWMYLALQRIQTVTPTDRTFDRDPAFNLHEFLKDHFGVWREEPVDVVVRFDKTVASSIRERNWHPSQQIREIENGIELTLHVGPSEELIAWILRWGVHAEVMSPEGVRRRLKEIFSTGEQLYRE